MYNYLKEIISIINAFLIEKSKKEKIESSSRLDFRQLKINHILTYKNYTENLFDYNDEDDFLRFIEIFVVLLYFSNNKEIYFNRIEILNDENIIYSYISIIDLYIVENHDESLCISVSNYNDNDNDDKEKEETDNNTMKNVCVKIETPSFTKRMSLFKQTMTNKRNERKSVEERKCRFNDQCNIKNIETSDIVFKTKLYSAKEIPNLIDENYNQSKKSKENRLKFPSCIKNTNQQKIFSSKMIISNENEKNMTNNEDEDKSFSSYSSLSSNRSRKKESIIGNRKNQKKAKSTIKIRQSNLNIKIDLPKKTKSTIFFNNHNKNDNDNDNEIELTDYLKRLSITKQKHNINTINKASNLEKKNISFIKYAKYTMDMSNEKEYLYYLIDSLQKENEDLFKSHKKIKFDLKEMEIKYQEASQQYKYLVEKTNFRLMTNEMNEQIDVYVSMINEKEREIQLSQYEITKLNNKILEERVVFDNEINKLSEYRMKYNALFQENEEILKKLNMIEVDFIEKSRKYEEVVSKYDDISRKFDKISNENMELNRKLGFYLSGLKTIKKKGNINIEKERNDFIFRSKSRPFLNSRYKLSDNENENDYDDRKNNILLRKPSFLSKNDVGNGIQLSKLVFDDMNEIQVDANKEIRTNNENQINSNNLYNSYDSNINNNLIEQNTRLIKDKIQVLLNENKEIDNEYDKIIQDFEKFVTNIKGEIIREMYVVNEIQYSYIVDNKISALDDENSIVNFERKIDKVNRSGQSSQSNEKEKGIYKNNNQHLLFTLYKVNLLSKFRVAN